VTHFSVRCEKVGCRACTDSGLPAKGSPGFVFPLDKPFKMLAIFFLGGKDFLSGVFHIWPGPSL